MAAFRFAVAGAAIAGLAICALQADFVVAQLNAWLRIPTQQGCSFYQWVNAAVTPYERYDLHWSGACTADKLLSGQGVLKGVVKPAKKQISANNFAADFQIKGTFVAGLPEGELEHCNLGNNKCTKFVYEKGCDRNDMKRVGCVPGTAPKLAANTTPAPVPPKMEPKAPQAPTPAPTATTKPAPPQKPDPKKQKVVAISPNKTKGCLTVIQDVGSFGGFRNSCGFDIELTYCVADIQKIPGGHWSEAFACEKGSFGATKVKAHGKSGDHTKGGKVYWLSCPSPQLPQAYHFEKGRGILGLCK